MDLKTRQKKGSFCLNLTKTVLFYAVFYLKSYIEISYYMLMPAKKQVEFNEE